VALGLTAKIVALHRALEAADLPHAFGGALALAFCTAEPRATKDIDVNVFTGTDRLDDLVSALPSEVEVTDEQRRRLARDAQARLWWQASPVDVFLSDHPFHDHAEARRRTVPFAGVELPVLACADLAVFKAFFARPKDAVDLAAMVEVGAVDLDDLRTTVRGLIGGDDRQAFLDQVASFVVT
jgi:hypothetical protein